MSSYALMTNVGRNKEAAALANGTSLSISQIAWGDGDRSPSGGETALLNETGRKDVQGTGQVAEALNTAFFEILLDANEGPFVIREAGLFDVDGELIAIAKYDPPINKPKDTVSALLRIHVVFSDLENLILQVQSTDAYVPVERKVTAGAGLAGGGDMSEDRELAVAFATTSEAIAATSTTKTMSPKRVKEAMEGIAGLGGKALPVTDLNTINKTCLFEFDSTATGAPSTNYDGRGWHIQGDGEASQIVVLGPSIIMFRDWDVTAEGWQDWRSILTDESAKTSAYSIVDAPNNWLIGENFNGDTAIGLDSVSGQCHRIGNFAHISLALDFSSFSVPANGDGIISCSIDINALASFPEWFASLDSSGIGVAYGRFTGAGWDAPWMPFYCSANKSAGTLYFSTGDAGSMPAQASNATGLELKMSITVLVKD